MGFVIPFKFLEGLNIVKVCKI